MGFDLGNALSDVGNWVGGAARDVGGYVGGTIKDVGGKIPGVSSVAVPLGDAISGAGNAINGAIGGNAGSAGAAAAPVSNDIDLEYLRSRMYGSGAASLVSGNIARNNLTEAGAASGDMLRSGASAALGRGTAQQESALATGANNMATAQAAGQNMRQAGSTESDYLQSLGARANNTGANQMSTYDTLASRLGTGAAQGAEQQGAAELAYLRGMAGATAAQGAAQQGRFDAAADRLTGQGQQLGGAARGYLGGDQAAAGGQQAVADRLGAYAEQGPGPSVAEAQLNAARDANMASAIGLARSGRGVGGSALAMRTAAGQNAATQQQTAQQTAILRAQEADAWRQRQLQALGLQQEGLGQMRGQGQQMYGTTLSAQQQAQAQALQAQQAGAQTGLAYGQLGQGYEQMGQDSALKYAGLAQGYTGQGIQAQQAGTQAGLGFGQLAQGYNTAGSNVGLQYNQLGQAYDTAGLANQLGWGQLGAGMVQTGEQANVALNQAAAQQGLGYATQAEAARQAGEDSLRQYLTSQLGSATNINTAGIQGDTSKYLKGKDIEMKAIDAGTQAVSSLAGAVAGSDIRAKKNIEASDDPIDMLRNLDSYSYDYKDPSAPGSVPGRQYGIMAQDLERTPAGASVVHDTPRGKMIDTSRLALTNTAALASMQREIDALRAGRGA